MNSFASRIRQIQPSATLAMAAVARAMKAKGLPVIDFGLGEPDFPSPEVASEAAHRAIRENYTKYTPPGGSDDLKDAILAKLSSENGLSYDRKEVIVSCGAKHTLYNIAQVLFEAGNEVILPAPYWVSYPDQVRLNDATPVILSTREEDRFLMTPDALKAAITPRTKAVILNDPSNPTGAAYPAAQLSALAEVLAEASLWVISDEIYEKFTYDGQAHGSIAALSDALKQKTILVNGVSKAYAMTGWRIGYAAGPKTVISAMETVQSQSTSNPASISQKAAAAALREGAAFTRTMVSEFSRRRDLAVARLNQMPGVRCLSPAGSFYLFPNVQGLMGKQSEKTTLRSAADLSAYLLEEAGVLTVPSEPFGAEGYLRLSYAVSQETLTAGLDKMEAAISRLS
jgi:aspartate aminotransferase